MRNSKERSKGSNKKPKHTPPSSSSAATAGVGDGEATVSGLAVAHENVDDASDAEDGSDHRERRIRAHEAEFDNHQLGSDSESSSIVPTSDPENPDEVPGKRRLKADADGEGHPKGPGLPLHKGSRRRCRPGGG
jgi:hypothetical protein